MLMKKIKSELIKRDGLKCAITNELVESADELSVDYIIPRALGGTDDYNNLILVKKHINQRLGNKISIDLIKDTLPGMREDGQVVDQGKYLLAEYEPRGLRLKEIAEEISKTVSDYFIIYDYKATIRSNNQEVLNYLYKNYNGELSTDDGDYLIVDDNVMSLKELPLKTKIQYKKRLLFGDEKSPPSKNVSFNHALQIKKKCELEPVLGVKTIAETLATIIIKQPDEDGMIIGVFGRWGRGKTYLLNETWNFIEKESNEFIRVNFSAWKYQDTKSSWAYLHQNLLDIYLQEEKEAKSLWERIKKFFNYNKRIWNLNVNKYKYLPIFIFIFLFLTSFIWMFFLDKLWLLKLLLNIVGMTVLIQVFLLYLKYKNSVIGLYNKYFSSKTFSEYLGLQSEIEYEIENLLQVWIPKPSKDKKIILFVDDIDRCKIEQVIDIIDGLRIILDNEEIHKRLIIITAIDEQILYKALSEKYKQMDNDILQKMHKEYLEKIFIIGLKLNTLSVKENQEFLKNLFPKGSSSLKKTTATEENTNKVNEDRGVEKINQKQNVNINKVSIAENEVEDLEVNEHEQAYLLLVIKELKNSTPRKIRIFYYKYLITKRLFNIRLKEKNLVNDWNQDSDEKVIADILIHISNGNETSSFSSNKNKSIIEELKYTADMVSIL